MTETVTTHEDIVVITSEVCDDISMWHSVASYPEPEIDDQSWFWTAEWQAEEEEATREIQEGQLSQEFYNAEEIRDYLASL